MDSVKNQWQPKMNLSFNTLTNNMIANETIYIINGYKFETISWNESTNSSNYGVYIWGTDGQLEFDFYGMLYDIIQLEYIGIPFDEVSSIQV